MRDSGIVFFFENNDIDVWSGRNLDLDAWNYNCKIGGINKAIIVNKTDQIIPLFDADMNIEIVSEIPNLVGHITQLVVPGEGAQSESLWDFDHQTDWYVLGPASGWGGNHFANKFIHLPQSSTAMHHSIFIGAVIAFHRVHILNNI
ncbi:MAG: hypothetical protein AABY15_04655 [Nanoarchaeota archaeon]